MILSEVGQVKEAMGMLTVLAQHPLPPQASV